MLGGSKAGQYISANYSAEGAGVAGPGEGPGEEPGDEGPSEELPPDGGDSEVDPDVKNEAVPTWPDDPPPVEPAPGAVRSGFARGDLNAPVRHPG